MLVSGLCSRRHITCPLLLSLSVHVVLCPVNKLALPAAAAQLITTDRSVEHGVSNIFHPNSVNNANCECVWKLRRGRVSEQHGDDHQQGVRGPGAGRRQRGRRHRRCPLRSSGGGSSHLGQVTDVDTRRDQGCS